MDAATLLTATERAPVPAPGRAGPAATPAGPSFAQILQRGQAVHGVLAKPTLAPPATAQDTGPEDAAIASAAQVPAPAPGTAVTATAANGAKALVHPREKQAPLATTKVPSAAEPAAAAAADTGDAAAGIQRRTAEDGAAPPGQVPIGTLHVWPAETKPREPSTTHAEPQGTGCAVAVAGDARPAPAAPASLAPAIAELPAAVGRGTDPKPASAASERVRLASPTTELVAPMSAPRQAAASQTPAVNDPSQSLLSGAAGAVPRGFDAGTLTPVTIAAEVYSPEFAQALGVQVSLLARDGVQEAELRLNPAEMGPISVQIEIDGATARVDFSANAMATREVIERGLPELATALREQGLTLTGGGVFQHPPGQGEANRHGPAAALERSRSRLPMDAAVAPTRARAVVAQGRVDLYA